MRQLLWLLAAVATPLALLSIADLLDGTTYQWWGRRTTLVENPGAFAVAALLPAVIGSFTCLVWLAIASDYKPNRLPKKLRGKPLAVLTLAVGLTLLAIGLGVDLLDGDVTSGDEGILVFAFVGVVLFLALAWWVVWREWTEKLVFRWKSPIDDPDKRGRM